MEHIDVFVQGEGLKQVVRIRVAKGALVRELIELALALGLVPGGVAALEDCEEALDLDAALDAAGVCHHGRVHVHRCRRTEVSVHYGARTLTQSFPTSSTVQAVWKWAVAAPQFNLSPTDALEHALELCDTAVRPDPDTHLGTLVSGGKAHCALCFNLVPKQRVEGAA
jgi:hypothetical protein